MRTSVIASQTRNRNRRQQQQTLPVVVEPCNLEEPIPGQTIVAMADRTMEELLRAPTEGYGEAIVLPEINADHFEIKTNLLQLVQANPENVSKTDERIDKLADQLSTLVEIVSKKVVIPPAPVKAVEENCVTCGGTHAWIIPELSDFLNDDFSSGNPTSTSEPFTSEFTLEEIDAYLYDKSISLESDHDDCDPEEDIYVLEQLLNDDPFQLPPMDLKQREVYRGQIFNEEPPELN
ncbi:hypothetical protein Tco_0151447 [Tanacetum coccineum]